MYVNKYIDNIRDQPDWKTSAFANQVQRDHNVEVSRFKAYRAKKQAIAQIEGINLGQFAKVWDYCAAIRKHHPGRTMMVQSNMRVFQRMYVCLHACKKGFLAACRPIVCVDGCFLKGRFGGQLLCAIAKDGNENMYPIAFAIVEAETKDSWQWFMKLLLGDIRTFDDKGWVIMSDKQKGLEYVLKEYGCEHRFCVRHLYANFKLEFKGKSLKDELWNAARASTTHDFESHMARIKNLDCHAESWLRNKLQPWMWSRHAFDPRAKSDMLHNNLAETFNSFILEAWDKPILTLCETIRRMLMNRFIAKREGMINYKGPIRPRIQTKLEMVKKQASEWIIVPCGDGRFEVENAWRTRKLVDLNQKTCTCRQWDLTGIPCSHAVACIYKMRLVPEDFVHPYYSMETFRKAYAHNIDPIPGEEDWPKTNQNPLVAPKYNNGPGRPKKARKKAADEPINPYRVSRKGQSLKCGNCGAVGHNARGCKGVVNPNRKIRKKNQKATPRASQESGIVGSTAPTPSQQSMFYAASFTAPTPSQQSMFYAASSSCKNKKRITKRKKKSHNKYQEGKEAL
ncbi:uncharacterized protein LOC127802872 isoform X2 [Diospyros lotus]|uniref:uncharacterized protein LOC127802872 isoform X2 n=1 Tax=Diospyros lotus TaxID=55363 RepID=UPI002250689A|nr:uncharacterized protein LOC127802872 isoform X2 [Diospyros lotus]